jgi:hypothetical protein
MGGEVRVCTAVGLLRMIGAQQNGSRIDETEKRDLMIIITKAKS